MNQYTRLAAIAMTLAAAASSASAVIIDNFSLPVAGQTVTQNGIGTNSVLMSSLGANTISGDRLVSINVTASTGTAGGTVKINNASPGAVEVDSDSDADAGSTFSYGSAVTPMNADLSALSGIQIRILASDLTSITNSITIVSTSGTSTASFPILGTIGALLGLPSPYDIFVPFASFVGTGSPADVDQIAFTINGPRSSDYTFDFIQTYVPEPASLSLLATGALACFARRRQA